MDTNNKSHGYKINSHHFHLINYFTKIPHTLLPLHSLKCDHTTKVTDAQAPFFKFPTEVSGAQKCFRG